MGKFIDLTGQKFGRLTVIERAENYVSPKGQQCTQWLCECDCENRNRVVVAGASLKNHLTTSCGCKGSGKLIHGKSNTRLYKIWRHMKERCYNPKNIKYYLYGKKGITICEEWLNDFRAFYNWSMANGYKDDLTIDRIDSNKNYSPDNCRWATYKEQNNHLLRNHLMTYDGKTETMKWWAEYINIPYQTLAKRLNKLGWSIERALTTPVQYKR